MSKTVDIVLSIYNPNLNYLKKQLESLNTQDYPDTHIYIYDDCVTKKTDTKIFEETLTNVPYTIIPSEDHNLGYVKAFEKLVKCTTGDYVAFCDQDDIWFSHKISKCVETLEKEGTLLVASEKQIINENDDIVKERSRENSKKNYDNWHSYDDIMKYTSIICYAVGMTIVVDGKLVRSIIPFSPNTGHDKWALICASAEGKVSFIEEPLVQYRRHGKNVSGTLVGVNSKEDYVQTRVLPNVRLLEDIKKKYPNNKNIYELDKFVSARLNHNVIDLWKYRYLAPDVAKFDMLIAMMPNFIFKLALNIVKKL